jgi:hypothetical protein
MGSVNQHKQRIDAIFKLAKLLPRDEETLAHWAKYLCVLASGFVEVSLREILVNHVSSRAHRVAINYIESRLEGITNLNEERVYQLLNSFESQWASEFRSRRTEPQKAALDSVVALRNQIAHGQSVGGLTLSRMTNYYAEIVRVVNIIEDQCVK